MGKLLKIVRANYYFITMQLIVIGIFLFGFFLPQLFLFRGVPLNEIPLEGICIVVVLIVVPTILLSVAFVKSLLKLKNKLELYENGIIVNGKKYLWEDLKGLEFRKTNYMNTPITYFYMVTDSGKPDISDLYYNKAHYVFVSTYKKSKKKG